MNTKPMRSVWRSLLWKEWHEHKWKLAMLIGLVVGLMLLFGPMFGGEDPNYLPVALTTILFCYCMGGGIVGWQEAAGENGAGTMPFLRTLPISMRKPAAVKLLVGWCTAILPIVVVICCAYGYLRWRQLDTLSSLEIAGWPGLFTTWGMQDWVFALGLSAIASVTSLLIWTSASAVNRSDEIRAGAASFLTMVGVWLVIGGVAYAAQRYDLDILEDSAAVAMTAAPGGAGFINLRSGADSYLPYLIVAFLGHGCLVAWYLRRFGQRSRQAVRSLSKDRSAVSGWLLPPRRNRWTAIAWKQLNETGPLAVIAVAGILAMAGIAWWMNSDSGTRSSFGELLAGMTLGVGYLVTVVTGMGVFLEDVKPKIGTFWRSRPIDVTQWFFVKFLTGLVVLIVCFGALFLLANVVPNYQPLLDPEQAGVQVLVFGLVFLLTYTLAMASYCMGRHPLAATVATFGILLSGVYAYGVVVERVFDQWQAEFAVGCILLAQIAAMVVAWAALRFNLGWHR